MHVLEERAGGGERALVHAVLLAALLDARAGKSDAISFLTDRSGAWAQSRNSWLSLTDFNPDVFRSRCVKLLGLADAAPPPRPAAPPPLRRHRSVYAPASKELKPCKAGSRTALLLDMVHASPMTFEEALAAFGCTREQLASRFYQVSGKGYGLETDYFTGKIILKYPKGYDRPLPHSR
jgi:hypothetical protein